ncbi:hypothetical protein, partial [Methylobrevis pamukkalensis]|uniref:hypothetical protein n=1 Tax=Methylobrevis pamukkalensis TaxID=1439726 RepID=UPI001AECF166
SRRFRLVIGQVDGTSTGRAAYPAENRLCPGSPRPGANSFEIFLTVRKTRGSKNPGNPRILTPAHPQVPNNSLISFDNKKCAIFVKAC